MKILITLENRFFRCLSGNYYSNNIFDYSVWKKYLSVFDEVIVCARVENVDDEITGKDPANGPGVSFYGLPMYVGPKQYLSKHFAIKKRIRQAVNEADAFMLRIPGRISTLLWYELIRKQIPYGVEVVGSVLDSMDACGMNPLLRYYLKQTQPVLQKRQCRFAAVSAYVSKEYLQKTYPPGGWTTYYSSIDLAEKAFVNNLQIQNKHAQLQQAIDGKRPFRVCHAGTMETMYKAQDDLIQAVSICRQNGLNIELVLMGDGKCRPVFEEKARQCGLTPFVDFLGSISAGQAVREQYDKADLLVFPSLTEGLPRVPIEAMARGLTCIGTRVGGIPELINDSFLVLPKCPLELSEKIQTVLSTPHILIDHITGNLQTAKEYGLDEITKRRNKCYEQLKKISQKYQLSAER